MRTLIAEVILPDGLSLRYSSHSQFTNLCSQQAVVATGSIYPEIEKVLPQYPWKTPRLIFRNPGERAFRGTD